MFEVKCDGETFVFQKFSEIEEFFGEVTMAVGALDAEISIRWVNTMED